MYIEIYKKGFILWGRWHIWQYTYIYIYIWQYASRPVCCLFSLSRTTLFAFVGGSRRRCNDEKNECLARYRAHIFWTIFDLWNWGNFDVFGQNVGYKMFSGHVCVYIYIYNGPSAHIFGCMTSKNNTFGPLWGKWRGFMDNQKALLTFLGATFLGPFLLLKWGKGHIQQKCGHSPGLTPQKYQYKYISSKNIHIYIYRHTHRVYFFLRGGGGEREEVSEEVGRGGGRFNWEYERLVFIFQQTSACGRIQHGIKCVQRSSCTCTQWERHSPAETGVAYIENTCTSLIGCTT